MPFEANMGCTITGGNLSSVSWPWVTVNPFNTQIFKKVDKVQILGCQGKTKESWSSQEL